MSLAVNAYLFSLVIRSSGNVRLKPKVVSSIKNNVNLFNFKSRSMCGIRVENDFSSFFAIMGG